ncbi:hypothetical protein YC2023_072549 [Brassica napus]
MRSRHLNVGVTLCHVSERRKRTPGWLKMPDQMSDAIQIFRDRAILEMRKLPMKQFRNSAVTQDTKTMIGTSHFCLLRRTVSTFRAVRTVRARTNHYFFSSKILPLSTYASTRKSGLLAKDFCKRLAHITRTNSFYANTRISASYPLRLAET